MTTTKTKTVQLDTIATIQSGFTMRGKAEHTPGGNVHLVQMKDLDEYNRFHQDEVYTIVIDKVNPKHFLKPDDILFRSRGITNTAVYLKAVPVGFIAASPLVVIRIHSAQADPAYVAWYLNHPGQVQISRLSAGSSVLNVNVSALKTVEIPLPPLEQQKTIAELDALAIKEQKLMTTLAEKRQTYLQAVLSQSAKT